jgi:thiamine-phosphate pyrophosphorylase
VEAAEAMIEGGARILQLRHKGHFSRGLFNDAETIAGLCRQAGTLFIIDDRADMARLLGAGVHLGQEDLTPRMARQIVGAEATVGFSTHNEAQLADAANEPADYVALGPMFATRSKAKPDPVVGTEKLRAWRRLTERPLVAIGGITRENAWEVLRAGADSLAVIGDLYPARLNRAGLRRRIEQWRSLIEDNPKQA